MGQIYKVNAPCQKAADGHTFCHLPGGTCICPSNKFPERRFVDGYFDANTEKYVEFGATVCYDKGHCYDQEP